MKKITTTVFEVHATVKEKFCDAEPFCCHDVFEAAPWLEEEQEKRSTTRISGSLSHLKNFGALLLVEQKVNPETKALTNYYITDSSIIDEWSPGRKK